MKAKIFTIITLVVVFSLALSGGATARVENEAGLAPSAIPDGVFQQMTTRQAQHVSFVSQIGGSPYAEAVQGDYAYVAIGPRLAILDVSDPTQPTRAGQTAVLPDVVSGVAVDGNYAYIVGGSGLRIIDVSLPGAPIEVGFNATASPAYYVSVAGNYAYVTTTFVNDSRLCIIDVSLPTAPIEIGHYSFTGEARQVAVSGSYAYVVDYNYGLRIIDVSVPAAPTEVGIYKPPTYTMSVALAGNYAYITDFNYGLYIIDVSTPSATVEVGIFSKPVGAGDVVVVGTRERGAVARNLLGSTALKLLRRCPATVWVARDCVWEGPATVLAAIDLGDMAPRVLGAAARIAQRTGGALHVLHVVDFAAEGVLRKGAADTDVVAEYRRLKRQRAEEAVPSVVAASLGAATSGTGPRPQIHLRFGDVNATIVGVAEEFRADVCVLGSVVHSAAGAALVGLGRTAEYVLPRLRSSLVVVKPAQPSSAGD